MEFQNIFSYKNVNDRLRGKSKIQWIFFPHFFIERFHAGDEVKNKHLTFSYKRQGILSGMLKTHKLTQKINTKLSSSYYTLAI